MKGRKPFRIVVAEPLMDEAVDRLRQVGDVAVLCDPDPVTLLSEVSTADALLIRGKTHVTAKLMNAAPRLKVIGRAGPSADHIDLRLAKQRRIQVVYAPDSEVDSAAEFELGLILALNRGIPQLDRKLRSGEFDTLRKPRGRDLGRQTVGLLGIDPVAQRLGRMISSAFDSRILYHDPHGTKPLGFDADTVRSADDLLGQADVVCLHLRLTAETCGYMNAKRIARMRPTAVLVNTSRGKLVDTIALAEALRRRQIAGAALDVFESEPLPNQHTLRAAPHCILTPHVAGRSADAFSRRDDVTEDVIRVLEGKAPENPVPMPGE